MEYKVMRRPLPGSNFYSYFYFKEHHSKTEDSTTPKDRTIFVTGLPITATEAIVKNWFSSCGSVESVLLRDSIGKDDEVKTICGYVIFKEEKGLKKALKLETDALDHIADPEDSEPKKFGLEKWKEEFKKSRPSVEQIKQDVDEFMKEFDRKLEEEQKTKESKRNQPDADGFVLVQRRGKREQTQHEQQKPKKKKDPFLSNFYKFQNRQAKREELASLRKKFEEDKKRIQKMRENRKFRPY